MFEGKEIPLNLRFGVFITMNPGYAGRTELPDNLKALFRPMAMMIPDYRLIAEISLYSEGFETAKELSRKMVKLYSLSSEQLSKQDHYDFGMRAVKSVLVMAGKLRRKDDTVPEDILLIRAMRDSNVPKFLEQDLPLFRGIIKDLFPTVVVPFIDYGKLAESVKNELGLKNLQCKPEFITKIIQLLETMTVRHGNMLVGTTGTGKTTVAKILANALQALWKAGEIDDWYKPVKIDTLNPKSVSMGELFGEVSKLTNEWTEGIIPWLVKLAVNNLEDPKNAEQKRWIIFDGPVDALWIENMNTVLDDNKMLCLNNGQRIKMPETCTMMFEVNDLKVASPATVSRCGMVYLEPEHLGWEVLVKTWQLNMADHIVQPYLDQIVAAIIPIFEKLLV
jgi:dynein heavy chain